MSLLTIINNVCDVINLDHFETVYGNNDPNAQVLVTLATKGGEEIARRVDWARTLKTKFFIGDNTTLPTDFQRLVPGGAVRDDDHTFYRPCLNSGQWAVLSATTSPQPYYYVSATAISVVPKFTGIQKSMEYVSNAWIRGSNDVEKTAFDADDNTTQFPERLLELDLIWRWRRRGGLSFEDQNGEFEAALVQEIQANRGAA